MIEPRFFNTVVQVNGKLISCEAQTFSFKSKRERDYFNSVKKKQKNCLLTTIWSNSGEFYLTAYYE